MKRVNVHLDEELDAELAREAVRTGVSKASLIRRAARVFLDQPRRERASDTWEEFTGAVRVLRPDDRHDDEVVYR